MPTDHRPPSSVPVPRCLLPVRFKMSQTRMNMSREGIDVFCDYCKIGTVITQVTHTQKQISPCERRGCGLDAKSEVPFRAGRKSKKQST